MKRAHIDTRHLLSLAALSRAYVESLDCTCSVLLKKIVTSSDEMKHKQSLEKGLHFSDLNLMYSV